MWFYFQNLNNIFYFLFWGLYISLVFHTICFRRRNTVKRSCDHLCYDHMTRKWPLLKISWPVIAEIGSRESYERYINNLQTTRDRRS